MRHLQTIANLPTGHSRSNGQLLFKRIDQLVKTHFYYPEQYHIKTVALLEGKGLEGGRGGL